MGSAVILPSIDDVEDERREFMIYESTFSDILGIIGFYSILTMASAGSSGNVSLELFSNLVLTVVVSIIISYLLIYVFQNIKGHVKLFLLIAVLLLLYAVGKMFHLSSLIIILIFPAGDSFDLTNNNMVIRVRTNKRKTVILLTTFSVLKIRLAYGSVTARWRKRGFAALKIIMSLRQC